LVFSWCFLDSFDVGTTIFTKWFKSSWAEALVLLTFGPFVYIFYTDPPLKHILLYISPYTFFGPSYKHGA
jgi:hypothetical protein